MQDVVGPDPIPLFGPRAVVSVRFWRGCAQLATDAVAGLLGIGVLVMFGGFLSAQRAPRQAAKLNPATSR